MTKEEMQRYLNQQAQDGKTEYEALLRLMEVLGLNYPKTDNKKGGE
jgi:hypothetical protein